MSTREQVRNTQAEAAIAFGAMLRRWRERNGWTQYTAAEWANQAAKPFATLPHSGLSELETGRTKHPRAPLFLYLGEMNARVAAGDYKGVSSRKILDELTGSKPICDQAGQPWGPAAFWECHAGIRPTPDWLQPKPLAPFPELTQQAAIDLGDDWREQVIEVGAAHKLRPLQAMGQFARVVPAAAREAVEDGLAGGFTPELLQPCWNPEEGEWAVVSWIGDWAAALAGRSATQSGGGGGDGRSSELNACAVA